MWVHPWGCRRCALETEQSSVLAQSLTVQKVVLWHKQLKKNIPQPLSSTTSSIGPCCTRKWRRHGIHRLETIERAIAKVPWCRKDHRICYFHVQKIANPQNDSPQEITFLSCKRRTYIPSAAQWLGTSKTQYMLKIKIHSIIPIHLYQNPWRTQAELHHVS